MKLFKSATDRELTALQLAQKEVNRQKRADRINHIIIGALGAMIVMAYIAGRRCARAKAEATEA